VTLYATCSACGEKMTVVGHPTDTHPCCREDGDQTYVLVNDFVAAVMGGDEDAAGRAEFRLNAQDRVERSLWQAARWYAARGWPVFPLRPGGKVPLVSQGFHAATTDLAQVDAWWKAVPESNIGAPTGRRFDVVDVDYHSYPDALRVWSVIKHEYKIHGMVATPGGMHYYLTPLGGESGTGTGGIPGLDYRGKGGYVVVPPSRRPDGRYFWWSPPSPDI
jgi:hypothetical protein